jgi:NhaP-type Na+/H+ or K+/H+ antiporter
VPEFLLTFTIGAVVLTVTALTSGLVERSPFSFQLMFLVFGFLIGHLEFGIKLGPHNLTLEVVATLTLALVLFLDAVKLQVDELGNHPPPTEHSFWVRVSVSKRLMVLVLAVFLSEPCQPTTTLVVRS